MNTFLQTGVPFAEGTQQEERRFCSCGAHRTSKLRRKRRLAHTIDSASPYLIDLDENKKSSEQQTDYTSITFRYQHAEYAFSPVTVLEKRKSIRPRASVSHGHSVAQNKGVASDANLELAASGHRQNSNKKKRSTRKTANLSSTDDDEKYPAHPSIPSAKSRRKNKTHHNQRRRTTKYSVAGANPFDDEEEEMTDISPRNQIWARNPIPESRRRSENRKSNDRRNQSVQQKVRTDTTTDPLTANYAEELARQQQVSIRFDTGRRALERWLLTAEIGKSEQMTKDFASLGAYKRGMADAQHQQSLSLNRSQRPGSHLESSSSSSSSEGSSSWADSEESANRTFTQDPINNSAKGRALCKRCHGLKTDARSYAPEGSTHTIRPYSAQQQQQQQQQQYKPAKEQYLLSDRAPDLRFSNESENEDSVLLSGYTSAGSSSSGEISFLKNTNNNSRDKADALGISRYSDRVHPHQRRTSLSNNRNPQVLLVPSDSSSASLSSTNVNKGRRLRTSIRAGNSKDRSRSRAEDNKAYERSNSSNSLLLSTDEESDEKDSDKSSSEYEGGRRQKMIGEGKINKLLRSLGVKGKKTSTKAVPSSSKSRKDGYRRPSRRQGKSDSNDEQTSSAEDKWGQADAVVEKKRKRIYYKPLRQCVTAWNTLPALIGQPVSVLCEFRKKVELTAPAPMTQYQTQLQNFQQRTGFLGSSPMNGGAADNNNNNQQQQVPQQRMVTYTKTVTKKVEYQGLLLHVVPEQQSLHAAHASQVAAVAAARAVETVATSQAAGALATQINRHRKLAAKLSGAPLADSATVVKHGLATNGNLGSANAQELLLGIRQGTSYPGSGTDTPLRRSPAPNPNQGRNDMASNGDNADQADAAPSNGVGGGGVIVLCRALKMTSASRCPCGAMFAGRRPPRRGSYFVSDESDATASASCESRPASSSKRMREFTPFPHCRHRGHMARPLFVAALGANDSESGNTPAEYRNGTEQRRQSKPPTAKSSSNSTVFDLNNNAKEAPPPPPLPYLPFITISTERILELKAIDDPAMAMAVYGAMPATIQSNASTRNLKMGVQQPVAKQQQQQAKPTQTTNISTSWVGGQKAVDEEELKLGAKRAAKLEVRKRLLWQRLFSERINAHKDVPDGGVPIGRSISDVARTGQWSHWLLENKYTSEPLRNRRTSPSHNGLLPLLDASNSALNHHQTKAGRRQTGAFLESRPASYMRVGSDCASDRSPRESTRAPLHLESPSIMGAHECSSPSPSKSNKFGPMVFGGSQLLYPRDTAEEDTQAPAHSSGKNTHSAHHGVGSDSELQSIYGLSPNRQHTEQPNLKLNGEGLLASPPSASPLSNDYIHQQGNGNLHIGPMSLTSAHVDRPNSAAPLSPALTTTLVGSCLPPFLVPSAVELASRGTSPSGGSNGEASQTQGAPLIKAIEIVNSMSGNQISQVTGANDQVGINIIPMRQSLSTTPHKLKAFVALVAPLFLSWVNGPHVSGAIKDTLKGMLAEMAAEEPEDASDIGKSNGLHAMFRDLASCRQPQPAANLVSPETSAINLHSNSTQHEQGTPPPIIAGFSFLDKIVSVTAHTIVGVIIAANPSAYNGGPSTSAPLVQLLSEPMDGSVNPSQLKQRIGDIESATAMQGGLISKLLEDYLTQSRQSDHSVGVNNKPLPISGTVKNSRSARAASVEAVVGTFMRWLREMVAIASTIEGLDLDATDIALGLLLDCRSPATHQTSANDNDEEQHSEQSPTQILSGRAENSSAANTFMSMATPKVPVSGNQQFLPYYTQEDQFWNQNQPNTTNSILAIASVPTPRGLSHPTPSPVKGVEATPGSWEASHRRPSLYAVNNSNSPSSLLSKWRGSLLAELLHTMIDDQVRSVRLLHRLLASGALSTLLLSGDNIAHSDVSLLQQTDLDLQKQLQSRRLHSEGLTIVLHQPHDIVANGFYFKLSPSVRKRDDLDKNKVSLDDEGGLMFTAKSSASDRKVRRQKKREADLKLRLELNESALAGYLSTFTQILAANNTLSHSDSKTPDSWNSVRRQDSAALRTALNFASLMKQHAILSHAHQDASAAFDQEQKEVESIKEAMRQVEEQNKRVQAQREHELTLRREALEADFFRGKANTHRTVMRNTNDNDVVYESDAATSQSKLGTAVANTPNILSPPLTGHSSNAVQRISEVSRGGLPVSLAVAHATAANYSYSDSMNHSSAVIEMRAFPTPSLPVTPALRSHDATLGNSKTGGGASTSVSYRGTGATKMTLIGVPSESPSATPVSTSLSNTANQLRIAAGGASTPSGAAGDNNMANFSLSQMPHPRSPTIKGVAALRSGIVVNVSAIENYNASHSTQPTPQSHALRPVAIASSVSHTPAAFALSTSVIVSPSTIPLQQRSILAGASTGLMTNMLPKMELPEPLLGIHNPDHKNSSQPTAGAAATTETRLTFTQTYLQLWVTWIENLIQKSLAMSEDVENKVNPIVRSMVANWVKRSLIDFSYENAELFFHRDVKRHKKLYKSKLAASPNAKTAGKPKNTSAAIAEMLRADLLRPQDVNVNGSTVGNAPTSTSKTETRNVSYDQPSRTFISMLSRWAEETSLYKCVPSLPGVCVGTIPSAPVTAAEWTAVSVLLLDGQLSAEGGTEAQTSQRNQVPKVWESVYSQLQDSKGQYSRAFTAPASLPRPIIPKIVAPLKPKRNATNGRNINNSSAATTIVNVPPTDDENSSASAPGGARPREKKIKTTAKGKRRPPRISTTSHISASASDAETNVPSSLGGLVSPPTSHLSYSAPQRTFLFSHLSCSSTAWMRFRGDKVISACPPMPSLSTATLCNLPAGLFSNTNPFESLVPRSFYNPYESNVGAGVELDVPQPGSTQHLIRKFLSTSDILRYPSSKSGGLGTLLAGILSFPPAGTEVNNDNANAIRAIDTAVTAMRATHLYEDASTRKNKLTESAPPQLIIESSELWTSGGSGGSPAGSAWLSGGDMLMQRALDAANGSSGKDFAGKNNKRNGSVVNSIVKQQRLQQRAISVEGFQMQLAIAVASATTAIATAVGSAPPPSLFADDAYHLTLASVPLLESLAGGRGDMGADGEPILDVNNIKPMKIFSTNFVFAKTCIELNACRPNGGVVGAPLTINTNHTNAVVGSSLLLPTRATDFGNSASLFPTRNTTLHQNNNGYNSTNNLLSYTRPAYLSSIHQSSGAMASLGGHQTSNFQQAMGFSGLMPPRIPHPNQSSSVTGMATNNMPAMAANSSSVATTAMEISLSPGMGVMGVTPTLRPTTTTAPGTLANLSTSYGGGKASATDTSVGWPAPGNNNIFLPSATGVTSSSTNQGSYGQGNNKSTNNSKDMAASYIGSSPQAPTSLTITTSVPLGAVLTPFKRAQMQRIRLWTMACETTYRPHHNHPDEVEDGSDDEHEIAQKRLIIDSDETYIQNERPSDPTISASAPASRLSTILAVRTNKAHVMAPMAPSTAVALQSMLLAWDGVGSATHSAACLREGAYFGEWDSRYAKLHANVVKERLDRRRSKKASRRESPQQGLAPTDPKLQNSRNSPQQVSTKASPSSTTKSAHLESLASGAQPRAPGGGPQAVSSNNNNTNHSRPAHQALLRHPAPSGASTPPPPSASPHFSEPTTIIGVLPIPSIAGVILKVAFTPVSTLITSTSTAAGTAGGLATGGGSISIGGNGGTYQRQRPNVNNEDPIDLSTLHPLLQLQNFQRQINNGLAAAGLFRSGAASPIGGYGNGASSQLISVLGWGNPSNTNGGVLANLGGTNALDPLGNLQLLGQQAQLQQQLLSATGGAGDMVGFGATAALGLGMRTNGQANNNNNINNNNNHMPLWVPTNRALLEDVLFLHRLLYGEISGVPRQWWLGPDAAIGGVGAGGVEVGLGALRREQQMRRGGGGVDDPESPTSPNSGDGFGLLGRPTPSRFVDWLVNGRAHTLGAYGFGPAGGHHRRQLNTSQQQRQSNGEDSANSHQPPGRRGRRPSAVSVYDSPSPSSPTNAASSPSASSPTNHQQPPRLPTQTQRRAIVGHSVHLHGRRVPAYRAAINIVVSFIGMAPLDIERMRLLGSIVLMNTGQSEVSAIAASELLMLMAEEDDEDEDDVVAVGANAPLAFSASASPNTPSAAVLNAPASRAMSRPQTATSQTSQSNTQHGRRLGRTGGQRSMDDNDSYSSDDIEGPSSPRSQIIVRRAPPTGTTNNVTATQVAPTPTRRKSASTAMGCCAAILSCWAACIRCACCWALLRLFVGHGNDEDEEEDDAHEGPYGLADYMDDEDEDDDDLYNDYDSGEEEAEAFGDDGDEEGEEDDAESLPTDMFEPSIANTLISPTDGPGSPPGMRFPRVSNATSSGVPNSPMIQIHTNNVSRTMSSLSATTPTTTHTVGANLLARRVTPPALDPSSMVPTVRGISISEAVIVATGDGSGGGSGGRGRGQASPLLLSPSRSHQPSPANPPPPAAPNRRPTLTRAQLQRRWLARMLSTVNSGPSLTVDEVEAIGEEQRRHITFLAALARARLVSQYRNPNARRLAEFRAASGLGDNTLGGADDRDLLAYRGGRRGGRNNNRRRNGNASDGDEKAAGCCCTSRQATWLCRVRSHLWKAVRLLARANIMRISVSAFILFGCIIALYQSVQVCAVLFTSNSFNSLLSERYSRVYATSLVWCLAMFFTMGLWTLCVAGGKHWEFVAMVCTVVYVITGLVVVGLSGFELSDGAYQTQVAFQRSLAGTNDVRLCDFYVSRGCSGRGFPCDAQRCQGIPGMAEECDRYCAWSCTNLPTTIACHSSFENALTGEMRTQMLLTCLPIAMTLLGIAILKCTSWRKWARKQRRKARKRLKRLESLVDREQQREERERAAMAAQTVAV